MDSRITYYIPGYNDTKEFSQLNDLFSEAGFENDTSAVIPRGGYDFMPTLMIALAFFGAAYAQGFIGAIANDHYEIVKQKLKTAIRNVRPPRHSSWPDDLETPEFCRVTIQLKAKEHDFIIDFHIPSTDSFDNSLDELPGFITQISNSMPPGHYLLYWNGDKWLCSSGRG